MDYVKQGFGPDCAWHGKFVVPDPNATRDKLMAFAGHNFEVVREPMPLGAGFEGIDPSWDRILDSRNGRTFYNSSPGLQPFQNAHAWDMLEPFFALGYRVETAATLASVASENPDSTKRAWETYFVTLVNDDMFEIPGDPSPFLPRVMITWSHDGTCAIRIGDHVTRVVCWNTQNIAFGEFKNIMFKVKRSKNTDARMAVVKKALQSIVRNRKELIAAAQREAFTPVTSAQRETFVTSMFPFPVPADGSALTDRVIDNVESNRDVLRSLFDSSTNDGIRDSVWGLRQVGIEFEDHVRAYRNDVNRLRNTVFGTGTHKGRIDAAVLAAVSA